MNQEQNTLLSTTLYIHARALGMLQIIPVKITYMSCDAGGKNFFNHNSCVETILHVGSNALCLTMLDFKSLYDINVEVDEQQIDR